MFLILRPFVPALVPPKIPDGEKVDFDVSTFFILYFYYFNFLIIYFIFYFFILYFILLLFFSGVLYTPYYTINLSIYMSTWFALHSFVCSCYRQQILTQYEHTFTVIPINHFELSVTKLNNVIWPVDFSSTAIKQAISRFYCIVHYHTFKNISSGYSPQTYGERPDGATDSHWSALREQKERRGRANQPHPTDCKTFYKYIIKYPTTVTMIRRVKWPCWKDMLVNQLGFVGKQDGYTGPPAGLATNRL